jgi:formyltetrahydrofolate-dependent phosphoribosylglycinamide formyltransferase
MDTPSTSPPERGLGRPVRLAVLLSGGGTTLQNLLDEIAARRLSAEVAVVIASRAGVAGIDRARAAGLTTRTVPRKEFAGDTDFNDALHRELAEYDIDLVILAGFLSLFDPRSRYRHRVLNIHPALIPAFSGAGYYGARVHRAVIEAGVKVSGCTVHFADDEYDHGPIILQEAVSVEDDDTPETLAARVHEAECRLYPEAIRLWAAGRLQLSGRRVRIRRP